MALQVHPQDGVGLLGHPVPHNKQRMIILIQPCPFLLRYPRFVPGPAHHESVVKGVDLPGFIIWKIHVIYDLCQSFNSSTEKFSFFSRRQARFPCHSGPDIPPHPSRPGGSPWPSGLCKNCCPQAHCIRPARSRCRYSICPLCTPQSCPRPPRPGRSR